MTNQTRILILGAAGSGKSTYMRFMAGSLSDHGMRDFSFHSTSDFLIHQLSERFGCSIEHINERKEVYRKDLINLGNSLCDANPGIIVSAITFKAAADKLVIIDGIRREIEFEAVIHLFDQVHYIISNRGKEDNFDISHEYVGAHSLVRVITVFNHHSLEDLQESGRLAGESLAFFGK